MCGLIGAIGLNGQKVNDEVVDQFQDQSSRGTLGFGAAMLQPGTKENEKPYIITKRSTSELNALLDLKLEQNNSSMILFHHRTPTSSDNKLSQTHPILVSSPLLKYAWLIAHNGMISNSDELKKEHNELGIEYSTDIKLAHRGYNDSEALAVELALFFEEQKKKIEARGSAAVIGLQLDKQTMEPICFFYGRNAGNPLHAFRDQRIIFISSTGKGELIEADNYTFIDLLHPKLKQKTYKIEVPTYTYSRGVGFTNVADDDDDITSRHWESSAALGKEDKEEIILETEFDKGLNEADESDIMYTELEEIAEHFVETICNAESVDYGNTYIKDMQTTMETMYKKMQDVHTKMLLEAEQKEADKTIVEAVRDNKIVLVEGQKALIPPTPSTTKVEDNTQGAS